MLTARVVIESARDRHPAFDRRAHPDASALRFLSRYQTTLVSRVLDRDPAAMQAETEITLAGASAAEFREGFPLPPRHTLFDITPVAEAAGAGAGGGGRRAHPPSPPEPLRVVSGRAAWQFGPGAVAVVGDRLLVTGDPDAWRGTTALRVRYAPLPDPLTRMEDELTLPGSAVQAEAACVDALAAFFAGRTHPDSGVAVALRIEEARASEARYLDAAAAVRPGTVIRQRRGG